MLNFLFINKVTKHKQWFLLSVLGFLLCFLPLSSLNAADDTPGAGQAGSATVSDEQVREILLDMLSKQEPVAEPATTGSLSYDEKTLSQWEPTEANIVVTRLREMKVTSSQGRVVYGRYVQHNGRRLANAFPVKWHICKSVSA